MLNSNVVFDCRSLRLDGTTGTEQPSLSGQSTAESSPKVDEHDDKLSIRSFLPVGATEEIARSAWYWLQVYAFLQAL